MKEDGLAAIVLAAGYSCRLGHPKQLVEYNSEPLIRRAVRLALEIGAAPAFVVLPAGSVSMQQALSGLIPVEILENAQATEGMGSSLRLSMETLLSRNVIPRRLLLLTCDQPLIEVSHLQSLLLAHSPSGITAARYDHGPGVPAVFGAQHFPALARANGDQGARALLRSGSVTMVDMPEAELDIDTPEDLRRLQVFHVEAPN